MIITPGGTAGVGEGGIAADLFVRQLTSNITKDPSKSQFNLLITDYLSRI